MTSPEEFGNNPTITIPTFQFEPSLSDMLRERGFDPIEPVAWEISDNQRTPFFLGVLGVASVNFSSVSEREEMRYSIQGLRLKRTDQPKISASLLFIGIPLGCPEDPALDKIARFSIIDYANTFLEGVASPYRFQTYLNGDNNPTLE